ncbi:MAG: response regulator [Bacteroidia bacterium]|nr:response regulator [Bacteroidia bacterium]
MKKILLIEDDRDLCETLILFLQTNNFIVYTAADGVIGVQEAVRILPDVIICDIAMPNLDGYGVYETLKQINTTTLIPFIFLTAKIDLKDIRAGMNLGADDYITKPFDNFDLLNTINVRLKKYENLSLISERKLLNILDNPINGIFIYQNKKLIYANKKFSMILGYENEDLISHDIETFIKKIIHQEDRGRILNYFQKVSGKDMSIDVIKFKALSKNQKKLELEMFIKSFTFNDKDSLIGYVIEMSGSDEDDTEKSTKADTHDIISNREKEVLIMICQGLVNKEIAGKLGISKRTVDRHRDNLMKKTRSRNTAELMVNTIKLGLIEF